MVRFHFSFPDWLAIASLNTYPYKLGKAGRELLDAQPSRKQLSSIAAANQDDKIDELDNRNNDMKAMTSVWFS